MVMTNTEVVRIQCRERTKVYDVDRRIMNMSPLFTDMLDELNEPSQCVEMDFADESSFEHVLEFCRLADYIGREKIPRRLL